MKPVLLMLVGAVIGLLLGSYARIVITAGVVTALVPIFDPSDKTYGGVPMLSLIGALIQIAGMVVGGKPGYQAGFPSNAQNYRSFKQVIGGQFPNISGSSSSYSLSSL